MMPLDTRNAASAAGKLVPSHLNPHRACSDEEERNHEVGKKLFFSVKCETRAQCPPVAAYARDLLAAGVVPSACGHLSPYHTAPFRPSPFEQVPALR